MLPDPLHPAIVHLPIALAVLVPLFALLGMAAIHRNLIPARSWWLIVVLQAMLVGSSWVALETGENEEDRVERIVAERHIEAHEEAAERFMVLAGFALLVSGAGLLANRRGSVGRIATTAAALVVLVAGVYVGHSGGELVYKHGAASAYLDTAGAKSPTPSRVHDDD